MIDLHLHCLPGVDDGAADLEEAVAMCRLARQEGCTLLIATPHQRTARWSNDDSELLNAGLEQLRRAVGREPEILLGGEIRVDGELLLELERYPSCGLQTLGDSRYVLLELDRAGGNQRIEELVHEVRTLGFQPIFAHPEFIPELARDIDRVRALCAQEARMQITAMSVTGEFGRRARASVFRMLEEDLVHFVASDAHDTRWRPPGLRRAAEIIAARWGVDRSRALTESNPQAVARNQPLRSLPTVASSRC